MNFKKKTLIFSLLIISSVMQVNAQGWNVDLLGQIFYWTGAYDVEVQGNYAYVAVSNSGLSVIDISDPTDPVEVGFNWDVGSVSKISVSGNYACASGMNAETYDYSIWIMDISNPENPVLNGSLNFQNSIQDVFILDTVVYVAYDGLKVIDISDPAHPVIISSIISYTPPMSLDAEGDILAMGCYHNLSPSKLKLYDISTPTVPNYLGECEISLEPHDIDIQEAYVYTATAQCLMNIVNIQNPHLPFIEGYLNVPGLGFGISAHEDIVLLAMDLFYPSDGVVMSIDVSDPSNPVELGSITTEESARSVVFSGDYAYVADEDQGFIVLDLSDPGNLVPVGGYNNLQYIYDVVLSGDYLFGGNGWDGIRIINVFDFENPIELEGLGTPGLSYELQISGNLLYVADGTGGLRIIYVSDPANPSEIGFCEMEGKSFGMDVSGDFAYIAINNMPDPGGAVRIINTVDPSNPFETGSCATPGAVFDVAVSGDYAYAVCTDSMLRVINVSDPYLPSEISSLQIVSNPWNIIISGNFAYIAAGSDGLQIIDISDPLNPLQASISSNLGDVRDIWISGNYAYIASRYSGIWVVDISDPYNPVETGSYDTPGIAYGITACNETIYVGDYHYLDIFDCSQALPVDEPISTYSSDAFKLFTPYPNPFNASTAISFEMRDAGFVSLTVFDITGREVFTLLDGYKPAGAHNVVFDAERLTSGVYFVRLEEGEFRQTRKILLLK